MVGQAIGSSLDNRSKTTDKGKSETEGEKREHNYKIWPDPSTALGMTKGDCHGPDLLGPRNDPALTLGAP